MKLYLYLLICAKERQNDKLETKAISYIQGVGVGGTFNKRTDQRGTFNKTQQRGTFNKKTDQN